MLSLIKERKTNLKTIAIDVGYFQTDSDNGFGFTVTVSERFEISDSSF